MRREDAPVAGWYPDPKDRMVLRWWDGLDWTEARRAPPSQAELLAHRTAQQAALAATPPSAFTQQVAHHAQTAAPTVDPRAMVEEVRSATRSEIERAAEQFTARARAMQREITPLVSDYTNRIIRWIRIAAFVAVAVLVAYIAFQVVAQVSFFDWLGDRIDNIFDDDTSSAPLLLPPA